MKQDQKQLFLAIVEIFGPSASVTYPIPGEEKRGCKGGTNPGGGVRGRFPTGGPVFF
jgi:hypothetical protein